MIWLWRDTQDVARMAEHSAATFWYVLPSLPLFRSMAPSELMSLSLVGLFERRA
jgi:hypothetical protein